MIDKTVRPTRATRAAVTHAFLPAASDRFAGIIDTLCQAVGRPLDTLVTTGMLTAATS